MVGLKSFTKAAKQLALSAPRVSEMICNLEFLPQYPEISLDLSFNDVLTDIVAERFDAGFRLSELIERDMIAVRVSDERPVVVAGSPAYFAQRARPESPRHLVAHDCIRIRFSSGTYLPQRFRVKRRDLEFTSRGD